MDDDTIILQFNEVQKSYSDSVSVLDKFSFSINQGETVALVGPSGSGKSTILSLSAGLEDASGGEIRLLGNTMNSLSQEERAQVRRDSIGFIFQSFELLYNLTALENVMIPAELQGAPNAKSHAEELLDEVGLGHRTSHLPSQLSGGERQRVAIARAFINKPALLIADEPTGNLDRKNSEQISSLLFDLNEEHQTTLLIATHDHELAAQCGREIILGNREIVLG